MAANGSGIFQAAYDLARDPQIGPGDREEVRAILRWFSAELKPHAPAEAAAVFWFKADAGPHIRKLWGLIRLLQGKGLDVRMWTSRRPGRIVFEDAFQVAAVPYRLGRREKELPTSGTV